MRWRIQQSWLVLLGATLPLLACPSGGGGSAQGGGPGGGQTSVCAAGGAEAAAVEFEAAFGGEVFSAPVKLVQHPVDDDRFYVVEQSGTVETLLQSDPSNTRTDAVDVGAVVTLVSTGERGLLGMAFDPDFSVNAEVFFSYTEGTGADFDSVLGRFLSPDGGQSFLPAAADPTVLAIDQPASNHNGGDIEFGPDDFLYYSLGDGGGGGDPFENGQDVGTLLGSILRLDVTTTPPTIPADNPFAGSEIFAFGLRNPWRISFDSVTGELWAGDVGQDREEEINRIVSGGNYGWDCFEGFSTFEMDANCVAGPIEPEVSHAHPIFQSITGGFVYRGAIPELQGAYVYGDFVTGEVCALFFDESPTRVVSLDPPAGLSISAFGQDRAGEIYVLDRSGNPSILQIVAGP